MWQPDDIDKMNLEEIARGQKRLKDRVAKSLLSPNDPDFQPFDDECIDPE